MSAKVFIVETAWEKEVREGKILEYLQDFSKILTAFHPFSPSAYTWTLLFVLLSWALGKIQDGS